MMLPLAMLLATGSAHAGTFDPGKAKAQIDTILDQDYPGLETLYKDIHAHPETAFHEVRTAKLLAARLRKLGFEVTENVGKTGIVGVYRNGAGPTILVRTELDGLPMEEATGLPYASTYHETIDGQSQPTAHSCGHDAHMAWWLGTAEALVAMKDQWHGTLLFVGQPAEETLGGAKAMLDDGLFKRFPKPDMGFAAHVAPLPAGTVILKEGVSSAATSTLEIKFQGRGGHGSVPSATIDPVVIGAHFVTDVQSIISREKDAGAFGVITIGAFNAGTVANIIPDSARLKLSLRAFSAADLKTLANGVDRTAKAVSAMAGAPAPDIIDMGGTTAMVNDIPMVHHLKDMLAPVMSGKVMIIPAAAPPSSAGDDFAAYVEAGVPSVYFAIGGIEPARIADYKKRGVPLPINHSPYFAPDPSPTIRTGVSVLTLAVLDAAQPK
jgi:amidohydrolase